ncbi:hypothetical protein N7468_004942 [Penicillium chermesinum]|uniref:Mitochondrial import inner membrane translocase subunit n=1 Tax=Penicillium chermesinum TaxID=63820 RepID=A0A9W9NYK8_9EURO|nr:uncharacterized protein N7468_004942 [Penicillium chermesinum]KAJ5231986.1 hypothetical protein N7468_004942 [Penicillium chermesinum]KAJ6171649.1 hypothetical protein N7470_000716 [Penicillium chermesinum]
MDASTQADVSKLNDADKKELQQVLVAESQKANIQQAVHNLNEICFKKCVTGKITSGALDRSEETCAQNCVERWVDSQMSVLKQLGSMRSQ